MEMKADIAGKPVDTQFHKIYIQRYENVRSDKNYFKFLLNYLEVQKWQVRQYLFQLYKLFWFWKYKI